MDFSEVVTKRYSIRQFQPTPVPPKLIKKAIELAKLAPSAGNLQSYKVAITREKVTSIDAPLYLVICTDPENSASRYGQRGRDLYSIQDATIFASYLQLALVDIGLSSVWVGSFSERGVRKLVKIPNNLKPIAVIPTGYPLAEKHGRNRRSYEEIVLKQR
jgi:nitroreductase